MLAIVIFGNTYSGRELAIIGVVVVVAIVAVAWFVRRRR